jgi:hypothetical protein
VKSKRAERAAAVLNSEIEAADPRADQRRIRPDRPITDLNEFLAFLDELEMVFGPTRKPRRITRGSRFLL